MFCDFFLFFTFVIEIDTSWILDFHGLTRQKCVRYVGCLGTPLSPRPPRSHRLRSDKTPHQYGSPGTEKKVLTSSTLSIRNLFNLVSPGPDPYGFYRFPSLLIPFFCSLHLFSYEWQMTLEWGVQGSCKRRTVWRGMGSELWSSFGPLERDLFYTLGFPFLDICTLSPEQSLFPSSRRLVEKHSVWCKVRDRYLIHEGQAKPHGFKMFPYLSVPSGLWTLLPLVRSSSSFFELSLVFCHVNS